ncbi:FMRFamide-like neuropeptides 1 [Palaemon carinicauda]|uniref:FMRFamide-like neuropeptides 1 n=1 Tax=Palaemon carinicauda TaxID=392227 RepID=UPI0035B64C65
MITTSWIILGMLCCFSQSLKPPVSGTLNLDSDDEVAHSEGLALPEKRAGVDRSFIRFGRSDVAGIGKNFLRFGRGGDYEDDESATLSATKRAARNFLRFGRSPNFLRFGRSPNFLRFGRSPNFLRFGRSGSEDIGQEEISFEVPIHFVEEPEDIDNIPRPTWSGRNFLRFGR